MSTVLETIQNKKPTKAPRSKRPSFVKFLAIWLTVFVFMTIPTLLVYLVASAAWWTNGYNEAWKDLNPPLPYQSDKMWNAFVDLFGGSSTATFWVVVMLVGTSLIATFIIRPLAKSTKHEGR